MTLKIRGAVLEQADAQSPFSESEPVQVRELTLDDPQGREILVRMEAASLCHSDLSVVDGVRPRPVPMLLGHEAAGIVRALGPDVTGISLGDRVIMTFLPRCGECDACKTDGRLPCSIGTQSNEAGELINGGRRLHARTGDVYHHLGVSGFASYAVVDERSVVPIGKDIPAEIAAVLGCAVLTGGGAVINTPNIPEKCTVIVIGLGGVGMAAAMVAAAVGHKVIGVDGVESKRVLALEIGASTTLTPDELASSGVEAPFVIDAAGNVRAFEAAVNATAPGGTAVTVGLPSSDAVSEIKPLALVSGARSIVGSYLGSAVPKRDIPTFVELWRAGKLPLERLISSEITLEQVNEGMDALATGSALRQIIRFDQTTSGR